MDPSVLIFDTSGEAAQACGDRTLELLEIARRDKSSATLAVSGGSTPRMMFQAMARRHFDWGGIELFQVDERCVPPVSPLSNFRMLQESLLNSIEIDESRIHRVQGELAPAEAARLYVEDIRRSFGAGMGELPVFDVIQRGTGPDGHTASLFPGEPLIENRTGIAAAVFVAGVEESMRHRVTLLRGVLEQARHTLCLATGAEKSEAIRKILREPFDPLRIPSQIASADTVWYIDKSAAKLL